MTTDQMKRQINALDFAQLELMLYLDVHPRDENARNQWMQNAVKLEQLEQQYTQQTCKVWPLRQNDSGGTHEWIEEAWPWDYQ